MTTKFLQENQDFNLENQKVLDICLLLKDYELEMSHNEVTLIRNINYKVEKFKKVLETEIKDLLLLRNKFLYSRKLSPTFISEEDEIQAVLTDSKDIFIYHIKDIYIKAKLAYKKDSNFFSKGEIAILSEYQDKVLKSFDYMYCLELMKLAFYKKLEIEIDKSDFLKLFKLIQNEKIKYINESKDNFTNYISLLEIRNRNVTYLS